MGTLFEINGTTGSVDFKQKESTNFVIEHDSSLPSSGVEGQIFWKDDADILYVHNGSNFLAINGASAGGWTDYGAYVQPSTLTDQIQFGAGSMGTPSISFASDIGTGIYRIGANNFGITTNGTLRLNIDTTGITSTLPYLAPDGSLSNPGWSFASEPGLGWYRSGTNGINLATNGEARIIVNGTNGRVQIGKVTESRILIMADAGYTLIDNPLRVSDGSPGVPIFTFQTDPDTGIYKVGTDNLGFSTNGNLRLDISTTTITSTLPLAMGSNKITGLAAGTTTGDSVRYEQAILVSGANAFAANQAMGGFKLTGLGAGTGVGDSLRYEQVVGVYLPLSGGTMSGIIKIPDGSPSAPSIAFANDLDTGMYTDASGFTVFTSNGLEAGWFGTIGSTKVVGTEGAFVAKNQSKTFPSYSFAEDTDTGIFRGADNTISYSCADTLVATQNLTAFSTTNSVIIRTEDGTLSSPGFSFTQDINTGFRRPAADSISMVAGGADIAAFTTSNFAHYTPITIGPTSNQLYLGTSGSFYTVINANPPAANRSISIPDAGANSDFVLSIGNSTISGIKTFDGKLIGKGTATNDSAASGYIGEYIESIVGATNAPTSDTWGDATSISLTAGDWDIVVNAEWGTNTATGWSRQFIGISPNSGNSAVGLVLGSNYLTFIHSTADTMGNIPMSISSFRVSLSSSATYYFKFQARYTGGVPQIYGRISARRRR